jgi:ribosome-associated translation inhibitor RaiA
MIGPRIEFCGITVAGVLRARVAAGLADVLDGFPVEPTSARVAFTDENGPKGGEAIRCTLEVRLARRAPVHVEDVAATARLAFEAGLAKLERRLRRVREVTRASRRRPKKYFAASRVLASA